MSRYSSGSLMDILVHSTVAGAGLSMGRDIYRNTRNNFLLIVVAVIALAGTAYGCWNMVRGHDRGPVGTFFRTFLLNAIIIAVSFTIFMIAFIAFFGGGQENQAPKTGVIMAGLGVQAFLALCGVAYGLSQRGKRLAAIAVDRHNAEFLDSNGFRDVGGREQTMLDPEGNELVVDDFRTDAVVFKVKGRRGVRSKIMLDATGRMVMYVPA